MHLKDIKNLARFKDIVVTLVRYGFDEVVDRLDVPGADLLRQVHPVSREMGIYERVRAVLEELGPTFVKFGQIMSLRPDLLPEPVLEELGKLQDSVEPVDAETMVPLIEKRLGGPVMDIFSSFHFEPVAAASLSQVYKGVLKSSGESVAVKVQRPNIKKNIVSDLDILETVCRVLHDRFSDLKRYNLPNLVKTIRRTLMQELDFEQELVNMTIASSYAEGSGICIPRTYEVWSSETLLVMEYIEGIKFKDIGPGSGIDRENIARQGLHTAVKQILEDGFFHADPHPGNLLVTEDHNLCLIDWGMVGRLTDRDRVMLIDLLKAVVDRDSDALVQSFLRLSKGAGDTVQPERLERDLLEILDRYYAVPLEDMDLGRLLASLLSLIRDHDLELPTNMVIMIKALITAEGSARLVYPRLDVITEVRDHVHRLALRRFRPDNAWRSLRSMVANVWYTQREIPRQIHQIIEKMEQGRLGFVFHLEKLEDLVNTLENASNRLTTAIITAAIIMGSSMIITTGVKPFIFGLPALGVIGYLISVVLGLYLVITILRSKRY